MLPQSYFPFVPFPKAISLQLCRPLLSIPKQRLIDTCIEMDVPYINDPMNMDLVFQRNRIRALLKNPPHPQFDEATTAQIMQHFYEYGKASLELTRKLILENVIADPQSGTLFLSLPPLKNENKNHWMHEPSIANTVLGSLIRWVMCTNFSPSLQSLEGLRNFICNYRPQQNPSHHCIHQTLVFAPRPLHNGSTNWIFLRSAPSQKDRHQKILPLLQLGEPLLFDDRFFVTRIKPPAQHSSPHLKSFYESLSKFLPTNIHLGETHELVVRHFHKNDELTLSTILNRRHRHTALIQYTRAYEHFKFKMPYRGRYALLVIALREKKDKWTNDHEESKLGQLIAIPSLGIHFMPSYFGFHVEYRQPLTRTLGISQTEENRDKKNLSLT
ncbi:hypothetical protein HMI55_001416 [Coelomomyces lativittatus]|nr:hypothetical protein HMI55_001416 [Coelomomyces lativittatus]